MALFKLTEDIKEFYPVSLTLDVDALLPTLAEVEQEILVEQVLGEQQYSELHTAYQADSMTAEQEALLAKCRPAVARLALHRYTPEANVGFSSGGLTVVSSPNAGISVASEWRTRDVERRLLHSGYRALDVLLNWLTAHVSDFPSWAADPLYTRLNTGLVRRTMTFDDVVRIGNSGWMFSRLLPTIRRVEETVVKEQLCSAAIYTRLATTDVTGDDLLLLRCCQKAIPHLVIADAIVELALQKDEQGVYVLKGLAGQVSRNVEPASGTDKDALIEHHRKLGNAALKALKNELQRQADANPSHDYRSTPCWVDPAAVPPEDPRTNGDAYHAL